MLVGVQMIVLDEVVVDVLRRERDCDALHPHGFQLKHHERSEDVLTKRLIDGEGDLFTTRRASVNKVRPY